MALDATLFQIGHSSEFHVNAMGLVQKKNPPVLPDSSYFSAK
jgi:hypothetical protein